MKSELQYECLINDILLDEDLRSWQNEVLDRCCMQLQRQRIRRYVLVGVAGIAAILLLVFILPHSTKQSQIDIVKTYLVRTTPLAKHQIIQTTTVQDIVQSQSIPSELVATTSYPNLMVTEQISIARISDSDMLNEFKGTPCGIIHNPDGSAQLVFFRPEDQQHYFYGQ